MTLIGRQNPELLIVGIVGPYIDRAWDGTRTGSRTNVETVGGPLEVRFRAEDDDKRPAPGSPVAIVVTPYENGNGASLTFARHVMPSDLQAIERDVFKKQAA